MNQVTITVPIPARILSPNVTIGSRGGRMAKAAAIKKSRANAATAFNTQNPGRRNNLLWKRAIVQINWFTKTITHPDPDNAISSLKSTFDGLADAGLLSNDRGLTQLPPVFQKDKANPRVELVFTQQDEQPTSRTSETRPTL